MHDGNIFPKSRVILDFVHSYHPSQLPCDVSFLFSAEENLLFRSIVRLDKGKQEKFPSENFHLAVLEWTGKKTEYLLKLMEIYHSTRWSRFMVEFYKSHSSFFAIAEQLSRFLLEFVSSLAVEEEIYIFITFYVVARRKRKRDDKKWAAANDDENLFTTRLKRNCGGGWGLSNLNIWDGRRSRGKIQISRLNQ